MNISGDSGKVTGAAGQSRSTQWRQRTARLLMTWAAGAALALSALPAAAQEFVKVEDGSREQLPATPFIGVAYGFIWVALLVYLLATARGLGRVQKELDDLRRRLERSAGGGPGGV